MQELEYDAVITEMPPLPREALGDDFFYDTSDFKSGQGAS